MGDRDSGESIPMPGEDAVAQTKGSSDQPEKAEESGQAIKGMAEATDFTLTPPEPLEDAPYLDENTGEPRRGILVALCVGLLVVASAYAFVSYWIYWWRAIHMQTFVESANLITWLEPRPGSAASIVAVCVLAVVGCLVTAAPAVVGYNAWRGNRWSRLAGIVAFLVTLLGLVISPKLLVASALTALATGLLCLPTTSRYFDRWQAFNEPPIETFETTAVEYGRKDNVLW